MLNVQSSMFKVQSSEFKVQSSMFAVQVPSAAFSLRDHHFQSPPLLDLRIGCRYRRQMNRWSIRLLLIAFFLFALPYRSPAPFIYTPGEGGLTSRLAGWAKWQRPRAKDQLDVAQAAFDKADYGLALKAARRVVRVWPLSDYAPQAQYLVGRCIEAKAMTKRRSKSIKNSWKSIQDGELRGGSSPPVSHFRTISCRQMVQGVGIHSLFSSMERTADMFDKVVKKRTLQRHCASCAIKGGSGARKAKELLDGGQSV